MKRVYRTILEVIIGIGIILFILSKIDLTAVVEILKVLDYTWILWALVVYYVLLFLTSYSLKAIFNSVRVLKFKTWARYYFMGYSLGLILPGRAGDLSIIYFIKDKGFSIGEGTALTIIDKAITLTIFGIIGCIGLFTILSSEEIIYGLLVVIILVGGALFTFSPWGRKLIRKVIGKYAGSFTGFHRTFKNLIKHHKGKLFTNIFITLIRPIGNGLLLVLLFKAMGIEISLFYPILISSITLIASLAPFTPNGLGVREGVGTYFFYKVGIAPEAAISAYIIILILNYTTGMAGVTYYLARKRK